MRSADSNVPGASSSSVARQAQKEASRSIDLLRIIEATIDNIVGVSAYLQGVEEGARALEQRVYASDLESEIDPNDVLIEPLQEAQDVCARLLRRFRGCSDAARADPALTEDDCVAETYDQACDSVQATHHAIGDLIFAVRQHDGLASKPAVAPFTSPEALITFLRS